MLVDSSEAWTPVPAVAGPVSAGQLVAQPPLQADWSPLSLVKAYRVRPSPSTRMSPSLLLATATVVPLASWAAVVVGAAVAAVLDDSLLLPPQAAAARVSAVRSAALANAFLMTGSPGRSWSELGSRGAQAQQDNQQSRPMVPNPGSPDSRRPRGPSSVARQRPDRRDAFAAAADTTRFLHRRALRCSPGSQVAACPAVAGSRGVSAFHHPPRSLCRCAVRLPAGSGFGRRNAT